MHNRSQFDALTQSLYDSSSPNYHHWLTVKEIASRFGPTAQEVETVRQFFAEHNLSVVKTGPGNFYVRARGTVGDVEKAFHIEINNYEVRGKTVRANTSDPFVEGPAGELVSAVSGLDSMGFGHPLVARPVADGAELPAFEAEAQTTSFFSPQCFIGTEKETFTFNNNGSLPIGTFSGNKLNLPPANHGWGCAMTPPMIHTAYDLTGVYGQGYKGSGQTIAIIMWCGSSTIKSDTNAFSKRFGLPQLTKSNFQQIYIAPSGCIDDPSVDPEIHIDVQWSHAIAPAANINLVISPTSNFQDLDQAEFDIIDQGLGNVISGSYGAPERLISPSDLNIMNFLSETAAANEISTNFATGDSGDYSAAGLDTQVSAPADSPWATAVGGATVSLNPDSTIAWEAGWGNNLTLLAGVAFDPLSGSLVPASGRVYDPTGALGFFFGAGGGASFFARPSYQNGLPGENRHLPDVSWLADPFTGAAILISGPGVPLQWQVYGGTSVATPMFSGLWALANEEDLAGGGAGLGQAAPYLYSMPAGYMYDVVPIVSTDNVIASLKEHTKTNNYDAILVMSGGLTGGWDTNFISAIWDHPVASHSAIAISFGSDCQLTAFTVVGSPCDIYQPASYLHTEVGWDNVTGVGTPSDAAQFTAYFYGK